MTNRTRHGNNGSASLTSINTHHARIFIAWIEWDNDVESLKIELWPTTPRRRWDTSNVFLVEENTFLAKSSFPAGEYSDSDWENIRAFDW